MLMSSSFLSRVSLSGSSTGKSVVPVSVSVEDAKVSIVSLEMRELKDPFVILRDELSMVYPGAKDCTSLMDMLHYADVDETMLAYTSGRMRQLFHLDTTLVRDNVVDVCKVRQVFPVCREVLIQSEKLVLSYFEHLRFLESKKQMLRWLLHVLKHLHELDPKYHADRDFAYLLFIRYSGLVSHMCGALRVHWDTDSWSLLSDSIVDDDIPSSWHEFHKSLKELLGPV